MIPHIWAVFITLIIYFMMATSYYGWGQALAKILSIKDNKSVNIFNPIWLGWAFSLCIFQILNFFLPLTIYVVIPVFLFGLAWFVPSAPLIIKYFVTLHKWSFYHLGVGIFLLIICVWVISRAMQLPTIYDTGLYHLSIIRWINTYAVIPGLGNLHGRLAFNQSIFIYVASLNFFPFGGFGRSLANSFLFLLLIFTIYIPIRVPSEKQAFIEKRPFHVLPALFLLPVLVYLPLITSNGLSSASADFASTLLQIIIFVEIAQGIVEWSLGNRDQTYRTVFLVILSATAITIKLSNLVFSIVTIGILIASIWQTSIRNKAQRLIGLFLPVLLILLAWISRGYILSGVPLYPSTLGSLPVDWAVPAEQIKNMANLIYSWARLPNVPPDKVLGNWDWLKPWSIRVGRNVVGIVYPLLASLVFCFLAFGMEVFLWCKQNKKPRFLEWVIFLPLILSIGYWFLTAPDPRFANSVFWLLLVGSSLNLLVILQKMQLVAKYFPVVILIVFMTANLGFAKSTFSRLSNLRDISLSGWQPIPEVSLVTKTTNSGLNVYIPAQGDQCWDAPLPCTPYFNPKIKLRIPENTASGFTVIR